MTGDVVSSGDMEHNNMVPWFGSKIKQPMADKRQESLLDAYTGAGTHHFNKEEVAPLFKPEKNLHNQHGAPNRTDFVRSRMNTSSIVRNLKPFEEKRVGPGLNKGYTAGGNDGYNSSLYNREHFMPKNVDQLRIKNNPKVEYNGVVINPQQRIKNRGFMGKMEQYGPDRYANWGPERWFTTTGIEKAQTGRADQVLNYTNRTKQISITRCSNTRNHNMCSDTYQRNKLYTNERLHLIINIYIYIYVYQCRNVVIGIGWFINIDEHCQY